MTGDELKKLSDLRFRLRKAGLFCFERDGTYFLYREVRGSSNTRVLTSKSIDEFVRRADKVMTK